jgi:hypothetical protein
MKHNARLYAREIDALLGILDRFAVETRKLQLPDP